MGEVGEYEDLHALIRRDLCRLARFGANISDAHSCFILLPSKFLTDRTTSEGTRFVEIAGQHSLSSEINEHCRISSEAGLIGWVARHGRAIHVSPFEHDSRTLGVYPVDQGLKSFIGIPVPLPVLELGGEAETAPLYGVIACDSKKSFAFSKLQGKLLEDLSSEVANTVALLIKACTRATEQASWRDFLRLASEFASTLGSQAVEILRIKLSNFERAEQTLGSGRAAEVVEQAHRLTMQAIPPHLPNYQLPNGDLVVLVDRMMTSFYENKIRAVCSKVLSNAGGLSFAFLRQTARPQRGQPLDIAQVVSNMVSSSSAISLDAAVPSAQKFVANRGSL